MTDSQPVPRPEVVAWLRDRIKENDLWATEPAGLEPMAYFAHVAALYRAALADVEAMHALTVRPKWDDARAERFAAGTTAEADAAWDVLRRVRMAAVAGHGRYEFDCAVRAEADFLASEVLPAYRDAILAAAAPPGAEP